MSVASNVEKEDNYSILHHFLRSIYGLGEATAHLHTGDCTGQNALSMGEKCLTGLHDKSKVIHSSLCIDDHWELSNIVTL